MTIRDDILQAVRAWVKTAAGLTDAQIILADGKGARPAPPYLAVRISVADAPIGVDETRHDDTGPGDSTWRVRGERSATIDLQGYDAAGATTTAGWLEDAVLALRRPDVAAALDAAGLSVITTGTVLDVSTLLDSQIERRHLRTIEARYAVRDSGAGLPELVLAETDLTLERYDSHPDPLVVDIDITL